MKSSFESYFYTENERLRNLNDVDLENDIRHDDGALQFLTIGGFHESEID